MAWRRNGGTGFGEWVRVDSGGGAHCYGLSNLPSTSALRKISSDAAPTPSFFSDDGLRENDIVHFLLLVVLFGAFTNLIAIDWSRSFTLLYYCAPLNWVNNFLQIIIFCHTGIWSWGFYLWILFSRKLLSSFLCVFWLFLAIGYQCRSWWGIKRWINLKRLDFFFIYRNNLWRFLVPTIVLKIKLKKLWKSGPKHDFVKKKTLKTKIKSFGNF